MILKKKKKYDRSFSTDFESLRNQSQKTQSRFHLAEDNLYPILDEKTAKTSFDRHYIYHTAWASRIVKEINPRRHTDISSALYFSTILSSFIPVEFYDFRPPDLELDNLACGKADLTNLHFDELSIESLSCMHVVEHVGLGRYGDPIDYDGDLKAARELRRVLAPGGNLLFVVPIGGEAKICFNAHRIYTYQLVLDIFDLKLKEFSLIPASPQNGHLLRIATEEMANKETYGCGCFWFVNE
jgi:SAM-dependent methyltransferase